MPTEGEWKIERGGDCREECHIRSGEKSIALVQYIEDARRIVTAVNCHAELVGFAKCIKSIADVIVQTGEEVPVNWVKLSEAAKAVLANAREGDV